MTAGPHPRRPHPLDRLNVGADTWELIWSYVHRVLVLNLGLTVTNLPLLVALAVVARPWQYPVFFGVLALGLGPSLAAAFGYLRDAEARDRPTALDFARAYRRHLGPATARWALTVGLLGVLITDIVVLHDSRVGAVLVPLLAVTSVLVAAAGVLGLAVVVLHPSLGLRRGLALAGYAAVRRSWLSLPSLGVLLLAAVIVNQAPVLGLATVPGCALVLVWANSRAAVGRVLRTPPDAAPSDAAVPGHNS